MMSKFDCEYGCEFEYGEKCIFLCDNMSMVGQDDVEV